ncbi:MAG: hypothetical protein ACI9DF_003445 [Verrucomicrobiales bacterium]
MITVGVAENVLKVASEPFPGDDVRELTNPGAALTCCRFLLVVTAFVLAPVFHEK